MTTMLAPMLSELKQEAATTRRVLDRVPEDKFSWKPHPTSMSLGQLAIHLAMLPGVMSGLAQMQEFDVANANFTPPDPKSRAELLQIHEEGVKTAEAAIASLSDEAALQEWRAIAKGKVVMAMPRAVMLRSLLFNHSYHHRGQLSVYLRMLGVPVPIIYGPTADESPFA